MIKTHENFMLINQSGWKNDERREFITAIKCKCETISSKTSKILENDFLHFRTKAFCDVRYRKLG